MTSNLNNCCFRKSVLFQLHGILRWTKCLPTPQKILFLSKQEKCPQVSKNCQVWLLALKAAKFSV